MRENISRRMKRTGRESLVPFAMSMVLGGGPTVLFKTDIILLAIKLQE